MERSTLDSLEAQTNPYYAAGEFIEAMGASLERDRRAVPPEPGEIWILSPSRLDEVDSETLRSWLLDGGRLLLLGDRCGCSWEEIALFEEWGVFPIEIGAAASEPESLHRVGVPGRDGPLRRQRAWRCGWALC